MVMMIDLDLILCMWSEGTKERGVVCSCSEWGAEQFDSKLVFFFSSPCLCSFSVQLSLFFHGIVVIVIVLSFPAQTGS